MNANDPMIEAEHLTKHYAGQVAVADLSFRVGRGEIVGLLGPKGAGKTTSVYMIVGKIKPNAGRIFLNEIEITNLPMYKRAQMGIGYLPQEASVFRKLSIEDKVVAKARATSKKKAEEKASQRAYFAFQSQMDKK